MTGERFLEVEGPYDFDESLRFVPFGRYDPTCRRGPGPAVEGGAHARRSRDASARPVERTVSWPARGAPGPRGPSTAPTRSRACGTTRSASKSPPGPLATLARRHRGIRLPRSPWVFDGLTEYVLQQRVTFRDAARAHRRLVEALGAAAPGPPGLLLPLAPSDWLRLSDGDLRRAGVDGQRARTLRAAARAARRVSSTFGLDPAAARAVLRAVPGCGPWTVGITMGFVLGDPDAVPMGDLHLPHEVGRALAAEPRADDARMLELLEPFRGHRFRLLRLLARRGTDTAGADVALSS